MGRNLFVTVPNMSEAIRLEKLCRQSGLGGQLVPTPRLLATSPACNMSWRGQVQQRSAVLALIRKFGVRVHDVREL